MSTFVPPPPTSPKRFTRSLGTKFFIVILLAIVMSISGFFVEGLTTERANTHGVAAASAENAPQQPATVFGVRLADSYRSIHRSLHYITLFLGLVFLTYFLFEVLTGKRLHPAQYVLVGLAQTIFYLLLLSLAEHIGFDLSYLIAGTSTVALFAVNTEWVFHSRKLGLRSLGVFTSLYVFIYVLLRVEAYALLVGAVASFAAVAVAMYITRNVDWYGNDAQMASATAAPSGSGSSGRESWLE
ncbi:MAG TPA: inner membrane CreD family protein [Acidobacteriaceae bacterium]